MEVIELKDTIELRDIKVIPDNCYTYEHHYWAENIPIVIDNGSYKCRAGWSCNNEPLLVFKNLLARPRKDRVRKDGETLIGNDISNIEAVRFQLKSQFDRNVVTQFEVQEQIFDYIFSHLGIDTEGSVEHPIFLTEALLNPNNSRLNMSELLFEGYHVPGICYGVDSLLSLINDYQMDNGRLENCFSLIVSCGYQCTHVIPVVNGSIDICKCRRIDIGGYHVTFYIYKLLQLKYPAHFNSITLTKAEALIHKYGFVATDYAEEAARWANLKYYEEKVSRIQLPYIPTNFLTPDQQRERRREIARKLVELNARKREEKLIEDEEMLVELLANKEKIANSDSPRDTQAILRSSSVTSVTELNKKISQLQAKVRKTKQKMNAPLEEPTIEEPKIKALKNIVQLPTEQEDLKPWLHDVYKRRLDLLEKRQQRRQKRQDMSKRGSAAAQERMRLITELARKDKHDDDFGSRDEDWNVYKVISKDDSDSEEEQEKLSELEELLKYYDPLYTGNTMPKESMNTKEAYQLHFGLERCRAPEILFQPSIIGCDQAGIAELIEFILNSYDTDTANRLANNVFLTGGPTQMQGFRRRIEKELLQMRPFESTYNVKQTKSPNLSAWYGAKQFANSERFSDYVLTYEDYLEKGGDYLKEYFASNSFVRLPEPLPNPEPANGEEAVIVEKNEAAATMDTDQVDEPNDDVDKIKCEY